jgi:cytochrome oxidase Cu insertion factor (SCO1/SenC/PrrC family)/thiol-disulfide isomerase/thioredoxin
VSLAFVVAAALVIAALVVGPAHAPLGQQATALATNPEIDPGTALSGTAPGFTLTNQSGRPASLSDFRGDVVLLAFLDPNCTSPCPQATTTMVDAERLLGPAGHKVALLGVDSNPNATSIKWIAAYTRAHGLGGQWQYLTGPLPKLSRVWRSYHLGVRTEDGQIDDTPEIYLIDSRGKLAEIYQTQPTYSSIGQQAQIIATRVSRLLPNHPPIRSGLSYDQIPAIGPNRNAVLPRAGGGTVRLGPDGSPRLYVFFASWLSASIKLDSQLEALNAYQSTALARGLPRLTAVDEGTVEPTPNALPRLLGTLRARLSYPVAIDESGRAADGFLVEDQPWFVLASRSGAILWYWDGFTEGPLSAGELQQHVTAALSSTPTVQPPTIPEAKHLLAGSPPALARLHAQAGQILGSEPALLARVHALRGYPIVINAWASWCTACQQEYALFADASVRYGRQVAFVGVDALDTSAGAARAYLSVHPLSYPSYQSPQGALTGLAPLIGLPTTIYIDRTGRIVKVIPGQYDSQGALDGDIQHYLGL